MYVYIQSEPGLWTVGFYKPDGKWEPESDHQDAEEAAKRVAWLNGDRPMSIRQDPEVERLRAALAEIACHDDDDHSCHHTGQTGCISFMQKTARAALGEN